MAKKGGWSVQPANHFRQQSCDKSVQAIDGCFLDAGSPSRRLDRHQLHRLVEQLWPPPKRYDAATRIGKTEQTGLGTGIWPRRDQPLSAAGRSDLSGEIGNR